MRFRSFEEAEWLGPEAGLEAVYHSHPVYDLELRLYGGKYDGCKEELHWFTIVFIPQKEEAGAKQTVVIGFLCNRPRDRWFPDTS